MDGHIICISEGASSTHIQIRNPYHQIRGKEKGIPKPKEKNLNHKPKMMHYIIYSSLEHIKNGPT